MAVGLGLSFWTSESVNSGHGVSVEREREREREMMMMMIMVMVVVVILMVLRYTKIMRCCVMFYYVLFVYSCLTRADLYNCSFYCRIGVTQKAFIHFMHLLCIIKLFCICICNLKEQIGFKNN